MTKQKVPESATQTKAKPATKGAPRATLGSNSSQPGAAGINSTTGATPPAPKKPASKGAKS